MFKDFIKEQAAMQFYPIISLLVFIIFFVVLSLKAMLYTKRDLDYMSAIPLEDENNEDEINSNI